ncbi:hypothetical protein J5N97_017722 [Dioscorea zingiberensis]|uniref:DHHA2 domain-containing protein n=1 Tax=Dioscorea zingiberensis TaxID=325984 RepID=A0A9D5CMJ0_9LILI|nr:hypothetical protein J5N97_017722 [Dioscorea zingiberensis]
MTVTQENVSETSLTRSLSSIWEFESKNSTLDTVNTAGSVKSVRDDEKNIQNKKAIELPKFDIPRWAASFYCSSNPLIPMCASVAMLNEYLRARKDDINVGVPGMFLHAVIGQEVADVGSVVSTILYAYFLNETQEDRNSCIVPVINMQRADLRIHPELNWLFDSCQIEVSSLVFIDEIDLTYYDLFGSLNLVLVNGMKLSRKQEGLKESLVETVNCEDCSISAFVAEKFAETSPEILAGHGLCRLLLSGILLDTSNLTDAKCTDKDKYMSTLLIKGAGQFGINGLHQILKCKKVDMSELKVRDILRKTRVAGKPNSIGSRLSVYRIGMCSIGLSVEELLGHGDSAAEEVILYRESEKLRLLMIVSGYHDSDKNFKREILVSTNTAKLMRNFLNFFDTKGTHLPLKSLDLLDTRVELKAFEIDNKLTSRRSIEHLLQAFGADNVKVS